MTRIVSALMLTGFVSGCAMMPPPPAPAVASPVGLANPASTYCISLGGTLEPRRDANGGEYSLCHLPNGTVMDEWALFRRDHH